MDSFDVTEQQLRYYDTFGFLKFRGLFADEAEEIEAAFERVWAESGMTHDHKKHSSLAQFADRSEYLSGLLDDPRVDGIVSAILGDDYNYRSSGGNYFVGDTNWHSDQFPNEPFQSLKVAFYLDPVTSDTGCLRLIPGSCHWGDEFTASLNEVVPRGAQNHNEEVWGVRGSEVPAYAVESVPGDLLLFNEKTKHGSWGGSSSRRMLAYDLEQRFSDELLPALRYQMRPYLEEGREEIYGGCMVRTTSPERMRHLEQRLEVWATMVSEGYSAASTDA